MSERRYNKLKLYAASKEKTMTQLIEDWVDRLPSSTIDDSSIIPLHKSSWRLMLVGDVFVIVRSLSPPYEYIEGGDFRDTLKK